MAIHAVSKKEQSLEEKELKQVCNEHLRMLQESTVELENSPRRSRIATFGEFATTKDHGEENQKEGPFFDQLFPEEEMERGDKKDKCDERRLRDIEERLSNLEVNYKAMISIIDKFEQFLKHNIMIIWKCTEHAET